VTRRKRCIGIDQGRARAAAYAALQACPVAIGELLAHELTTWGEFGHRFGSHELIACLLDDINERRWMVWKRGLQVDDLFGR
jgi:hypothetical protein